MTQPRTLLEKIHADHVILSDGEQDLLFIDRHFIHEGSFHAFDKLAAADHKVHRPQLTFAVADHYAPSRGDEEQAPEIAEMITRLSTNTQRHGLGAFTLGDPRQGIVHVTMPEQGLTLPGTTIVCGDSHTSTHGAFGAYAFGIGASEVAHVLATQTLWQRRPDPMRICVNGVLPFGCTAKDLALYLIGEMGTAGATGYVVEYVGEAISALSMEGRMTLCNMTIELGARAGLIPPDQTTFDWLKGRANAPKGAEWEKALESWSALYSDPSAVYGREHSFDARNVAPMVTWGASPEEVAPVNSRVPIATNEKGVENLAYMGLSGGEAIEDIAIDQAFIGSCTNARLEDLQAAAEILRNRKVKVPLLVSPGSSAVKREAERQGLDAIFISAGAIWGKSACSLCVGMNGDRVAPGRRCASTSNRNFKGRQGPGARTHLMSPAMVAAAAVHGHMVDIRSM